MTTQHKDSNGRVCLVQRTGYGWTVVPFMRTAEWEWVYLVSAPKGWYRMSYHSSGCGHSWSIAFYPEQPEEGDVRIDGRLYGKASYVDPEVEGYYEYPCHGQTQVCKNKEEYDAGLLAEDEYSQQVWD